MNKNYWPAFLLIAAGVVLLLYEMDLFYLNTADFISYGLVLLGIVLLVNSIMHPQKKGILGGVFFLLFGAAMVMMREYMLPKDDEFGLGIFFAALAVANLAAMLTRKNVMSNLIWAVVFGIVAGVFFWAYYGYYSTWYVFHQVGIFWPVILIVIGLMMVIKALSRKRRSVAVNG